MSLKHDFINPFTDEIFKVDDWFISYFSDYFNWINTLNTSTKIYEQGLTYYGQAKIDILNMQLMIDIIKGLISLYRISPDKLIFTGNYIIDEGYEKINIDKEHFLFFLSNFEEFLQKAVDNTHEIFYEGI